MPRSRSPKRKTRKQSAKMRMAPDVEHLSDHARQLENEVYPFYMKAAYIFTHTFQRDIQGLFKLRNNLDDCKIYVLAISDSDPTHCCNGTCIGQLHQGNTPYMGPARPFCRQDRVRYPELLNPLFFLIRESNLNPLLDHNPEKLVLTDESKALRIASRLANNFTHPELNFEFQVWSCGPKYEINIPNGKFRIICIVTGKAGNEVQDWENMPD